MATSKIVTANEKIAEKVVAAYEKVEDTVVAGYTKIEDAFVDRYLTRDGETVQEAKERLIGVLVLVKILHHVGNQGLALGHGVPGDSHDLI